MLGKNVLQQLSAYQQGMQIDDVIKKYNLDRIVKLSSNENPYGFSHKVHEALNTLDFEIYPDGYAYELRMAMAEKLSLDPDQLVFGAGSDELITCICRAFLHEGTNTIMAKPTFSQYRHHALIEGANIKEVRTYNGRHQLDKMAEQIDEGTKVVWICTPDNPSGEVVTDDEFHQFMTKCPTHVIVVLDEAYFEYMTDELRLDLHDNLKKYPNLIVLRTFSKAYGLAGLRIGYGIMSKKLAHLLNVVRGPFNTTSLTQRAALASLKDDSFILESKKKNREVLEKFEQFLDSIHYKYYNSQTNFILMETPIDADEFATYLLEHGFIVRSGTALGYPNTVRITIGKAEDMKQLEDIILSFHKKLSKEGTE